MDRKKAIYQKKDLLGLEELTASEITFLLDETEYFRNWLDSPKGFASNGLENKTVALLFYESSTRTRTSFELACSRLGARVVSLSISTSSVAKGETLLDTVENLIAMKIDCFVIRHQESGVLHHLASRVGASIVNGGDGMHEHPTQALLDLFTIRRKKGRIKGLKVVILGDILHSRVARSNIWGLKKLGARITLCGPATLVPGEFKLLGVDISHNLSSALKGADVVNVLRLQFERQKESLFPSLGEYTAFYGLNSKRLALAKPDCIVMHPGPMNRGIEIAPDVADGKQSVILEQVTSGVAVRMAVLNLLLRRQGKK